MYKRVDIDEDTTYAGWSFVDEDEDEFRVSVDYDVMRVGSEYDHFSMYKRDIPKLIKALQEAYKYEE